MSNRQLVAGSIGISLVVALYVLMTARPSSAVLMGAAWAVGISAIALGLNIARLTESVFAVVDSRNRLGKRQRTRVRLTLGLIGALLCVWAFAVALTLAGGATS